MGDEYGRKSGGQDGRVTLRQKQQHHHGKKLYFNCLKKSYCFKSFFKIILSKYVFMESPVVIIAAISDFGELGSSFSKPKSLPGLTAASCPSSAPALSSSPGPSQLQDSCVCRRLLTRVPAGS